MASTNHTTYFDLSQYSANDKPTYLVDYNGDMSKIDAGLHEADSDAKTAITEIGDLANLTTTAKNTIVASINEVDAEADANTSHIGNLSNLTTTANTDLVSSINEVDAEADANTSHIGTLANLDTTVKTNLVGAVNEVNSKIGEINLTTFNTYNNSSNITISGATPSAYTIQSVNITVAKNDTGSLAKVYGRLQIGSDGTQSGGDNYSFLLNVDTGLRPSTDITINALGIRYASSDNNIYPIAITIKTDGKIELANFGTNGAQRNSIIFSPCLIFVKDFGDTPINP